VEAVRRAQDGDEPSFHAVVEELGPLVYRFLVVRLGHEGDAKDALQETLIAAWRGLADLQRPDRVRSWLMTIAARKAAEAFRARPELIDAPERELAGCPAKLTWMTTRPLSC
jgi:RNA polymerase sigma-70 factor, ECF subfamily